MELEEYRTLVNEVGKVLDSGERRDYSNLIYDKLRRFRPEGSEDAFSPLYVYITNTYSLHNSVGDLPKNAATFWK